MQIGNTSVLDPLPVRYFHDENSVEGVKTIFFDTFSILRHTTKVRFGVWVYGITFSLLGLGLGLCNL